MESLSLKITDQAKHIQPSTEIHKDYSDAQKAKIAKASKDFESLLTGMMIKSMTNTTEGLFGSENFGGDVLDTIFESELAGQISSSKGLGVADRIYQKLTGEKIQDLPLPKPGIENLKAPKPEDKAAPIVPSGRTIDKLNRFDDIINEASEKYGVPKNIIKSIILTESAANEKAVSHAKAKGLMQLMDSTASDMGVKNSFDPKDNVLGGTKYFAKMLRQYDGDINLALAAYNAGPGNVEKYDGIPPFDETKKYISRVLGYLNHLES